MEQVTVGAGQTGASPLKALHGIDNIEGLFPERVRQSRVGSLVPGRQLGLRDLRRPLPVSSFFI